MIEGVLLTIVIFSLSGCSVFSISNRGAKVTVESKPKQPSVIVNGSVNGSVKAKLKKTEP